MSQLAMENVMRGMLLSQQVEIERFGLILAPFKIKSGHVYP
jgi:hypothetical protein